MSLIELKLLIPLLALFESAHKDFIEANAN